MRINDVNNTSLLFGARVKFINRGKRFERIEEMFTQQTAKLPGKMTVVYDTSNSAKIKYTRNNYFAELQVPISNSLNEKRIIRTLKSALYVFLEQNLL